MKNLYKLFKSLFTTLSRIRISTDEKRKKETLIEKERENNSIKYYSEVCILFIIYVHDATV